MVPVGTAVLGAQLAPDEEVRRLDIYHEFFRPAGAVHLLGVVFLNEPCAFGEISLWRPEQRERHGSRELEIANVLARHLQRAFRIARHMQATWTKAAQLEAALGPSRGRLSPRRHQRTADPREREGGGFLRASEPLRLVQGRIVADGAANQRVGNAAGATDPRRRASRGDSRGARDRDGTPLRVLALPLTPPRSETLGLTPPSAPLGLVCIGSTAPRPEGAAAMLQGRFGLTPAQADLTVALFGGESLQEYADRRERSLNTVRTHLKEVFAKTGARRQAELVSKLATLGLVAR